MINWTFLILTAAFSVADIWRPPWVATAAGFEEDGKMTMMKTSYACQGKSLKLECTGNNVIKVVRANFGRFSVAICNDAGRTDWSVNCMAPRSLRIMQDRCNLKHSCEILAEIQEFGKDPCVATPKYLEVNYGCYQESTTTTTPSLNALPPWLTTKSSIPFYPDMFDLEITPPPRRVPITARTQDKDRTIEDRETTTEVPTTMQSSIKTTTIPPSTTTITLDTTMKTLGNNNSSENMTSKGKSNDMLKNRTNSNSPVESNGGAKYIYAAENTTNDTVKIVLSTLPSKFPIISADTGEKIPTPRSNNPIMQPGKVSPRTNTNMSTGKHCPPRRIRALSWDWTLAGTEAILECPQGTSGFATWKCVLVTSNTGSTAMWETPSPQLDRCESHWMTKIQEDLKKSSNIVNIAQDMVQYIAANALYGGDIKSAINAIGIIAEKMHFQLNNIPTQEQKEAVVMEVCQSIIKSASILLSEHMLPAWQDLQQDVQRKFLSNFMRTLENTGMLLPRAVTRDQEASISSQNILLSVKKISFRNIRKTHFPSRASLATRDWQEYQNSIEIPSLVLMENMKDDVSEIVFLTFKNLENLLLPTDVAHIKMGKSDQVVKRTHQIVNSQIIFASMGHTKQRTILNEPITMLFRHKSTHNVTNPKCVFWDFAKNSWSGYGCRLLFTNSSHSQCSCGHLSSFALVDEVEVEDNLSHMTFLVVVIIAITVSFVTVVSLVLLIIYCRKVKVQDHWKKRLSLTSMPCIKTKGETRSYKANLYGGSPTFMGRSRNSSLAGTQNFIPKNDFMILSQSQLSSCGEYLECRVGPQVPTNHLRNSERMSSISRQQQYTTRYAHEIADTQGQLYQPALSSQQYGRAHIYMEVDPIYSGIGQLHHSDTHSEIMSSEPSDETEILSSTSSQASSGYSTAPSYHVQTHTPQIIHGSNHPQRGNTTSPSHPVQGYTTKQNENPFILMATPLSRGTASVLRSTYGNNSIAGQHQRHAGAPDLVFSISQGIDQGMVRKHSLGRDRKNALKRENQPLNQSLQNPLLRLEESQMI